MRRIQLALIVALAISLYTCVNGQEVTTRTYSDLVRTNVLIKGTTRTHRDLGRTSSSEKWGKAKGKRGKTVWKEGGKSNSHDDSTDVTDFYGFQPQHQSQHQQQHQSNDDGDSMIKMNSQSASLSDSTSKTSKKNKKSKKGDSRKQSHKLSKRSRSSSSSKGHAASPTASPTRTSATNPTYSPTTSGGSARHLTHFALEYTVTEDDRIPFRSELLEVVELTRGYLDTYFRDIFEDNKDFTLIESITIFTDSQSDFGDPVYIAYRSSATFEASEGPVLSIQELESLLKAAFLGRNLDGYLGMLQALAPSNLFSTTAFVTQVDVREERQSLSAVATVGIRTKTSANGQYAMAAVAAGVTCLTLMGAAGLFVRRQSCPTSERPSEKYEGDATSFTTATWSLDHASALQPMHSCGRISLT